MLHLTHDRPLTIMKEESAKRGNQHGESDLNGGLDVSLNPKCDKCKSKEHVICIGPDMIFGHEFRCTKCRLSWVQTI